MAQSNFEKKNVLITGGAGFIGSHLCERILEDARVVCVDNLITGEVENINHLLKNPDFKFLRHDVTEPLDLDRFPELKAFQIPFQGIQEIYHLAAPSSPVDYTKYPLETLLANAYGTKNMLYLVLKYRSRFLLASSAAVYGEPPQENPYFTERDIGAVDFLGPRSAYSEGKRFAECLVANFYKSYKLSLKIARIFNTYGPRVRALDGRLVPNIIPQAIANEPIIVHGSQEDISSFCYVSDTVDAVVKLMSKEYVGPVNIGNPEKVTKGQVVRTVIDITGSKSPVEWNVAPPTHRRGLPDITLAREKMGWFPVVALREGLDQTITYMKAARGVMKVK